MKKIITSFLLAVISLGVWAADPEVVFDLTSQTNFNKCEQYKYSSDSFSKQTSLWYFYSSYSAPYVSSTYAGDYYLVTPEIEMQAGNEYAVKMKPYIYSSYYTSKAVVKVLFGQGDDLTTYEYLGQDEVTATYYNAATESEIKFVCETDGNYKVAFEVDYSVYLYQTKIYKYGESVVPKAPADFKVMPDADGDLRVELSFTMPDKTVTGQDLENPTYTLFKGDEEIEDKVNVSAAPGEKINFTQDLTEEGNVSYSVQIACNDEVSKKVTVETYVGIETATSPTDVQISLDNGKYVVSWNAPEKGVNGAQLVPAKLTYKIVRYLDEEATTLTEELAAETSFTDDFEFTGLHKLKYTVAAKYLNADEFSDAEESKTVTIGTVELPFEDSFAGGELNPFWNLELTMGTATTPMYYWRPVTEGVRGQNKFAAYDDDEGLIWYEAWSIQRNNACRMSTPPISFEAGLNPVVSFAHWGYTTTQKDYITVEICTDKGEWVEIPNAKFTAGGYAEAGWKVENIKLGEYIPEGTSEFQVALHAYSDYGTDLWADAFKVFNQIDKDLCIDAFTVSEKAHAGDNIEIMIKVSNNGVDEVAADAYSIEIEHDFTDEFEIGELEAIPSLGSVTYHVSVPVHSLHLYNVDSFEFTAKVVYDGDEAPENNQSETKVIESSYSEGQGAKIVKSTFDEEGNYYIYWEPTKDLEYEPVNISESFEGFEDDFEGPFNGWVTVDLDGNNYGNYYSTNGSKFNVVVSPTSPSGIRTNMDGSNVIGLTIMANTEQNDWLISPAINCKEGSVMDLDFLMGVKSNTMYYVKYGVEILYTTEDEYNAENPAESFTKKVTSAYYESSDRTLPHDETFHRLTFKDIPAEAKYVAIHFNAKSTSTAYWMAVWVDDIHLVERDEMALQGYHVYSLATNGRLNEEIIDANETEFVFKPEAEPQSVIRRAAANFASEPSVFVTAVYPDGEAKAQNTWNYAELSVTGIENVAVDGADEAEAEYFNLQGMKVRGENLTPGIYIIRSNGASRKVYLQ